VRQTLCKAAVANTLSIGFDVRSSSQCSAVTELTANASIAAGAARMGAASQDLLLKSENSPSNRAGLMLPDVEKFSLIALRLQPSGP
jgi:hypothetical protein